MLKPTWPGRPTLKTRYWSDTAHREFAALFEDADHSPVFVEKVADALIRGWPPNRDKPLWALALVVTTLGSSAAGGRASGLELLSMSPAEALQTLRRAPRRAGPVTLEAAGGAVRLSSGGASIVLGRTRIGLLRKVAEFLLAADGYRDADAIVALFGGLAGLGARGKTCDETLREGVRALSRRLYEYRKTHFREGQAACAFDAVRRAVGAGGQLSEEVVLRLWAGPGAPFGTFRTALGAALEFERTRSGARRRGLVDGAASIDEPGGERTLGLCADPETASSAPSALGLVAHHAEEAPQDLSALRDTPLNLFTRAELDFAELAFAVWPDAAAMPRSVLRLLAFQPIQSGLSNSLRTGRAKVPLAERVRCVEAASYREIGDRLAALEAKARGWMAAHLALSHEGDASGRAAEVIEEGRKVLRHTRSKTFDRPAEELTAAFEEVGPTLIALARMLAALTAAIASFDRRQGLDEAFALDRTRFAEAFAARYLAKSDEDREWTALTTP